MSTPPPRTEAEALALELLRTERWTEPGVIDAYQTADTIRETAALVARIRKTETAAGPEAADWDRLALAAHLETEMLALDDDSGLPA